MYNTLSQHRLRWLGHFMIISNERIPKDLLYSSLANVTLVDQDYVTKTFASAT